MNTRSKELLELVSTYPPFAINLADRGIARTPLLT